MVAFSILDLGLPMSLEVRHVAQFKKEHEVQKEQEIISAKDLGGDSTCCARAQGNF